MKRADSGSFWSEENKMNQPHRCTAARPGWGALKLLDAGPAPLLVLWAASRQEVAYCGVTCVSSLRSQVDKVQIQMS